MKNGKRKFTAFLMGLTLLLILSACGGEDDKPKGGGGETDSNPDNRTVKIGSLYDITGGSGDTGTPYSEGQEAYFSYLKSKGGVDGLNIEHKGEDYGYEISNAQRSYQSYRDRDKVSGILGWGTGDTEALRQQVASDKIPYISASYSEALNNQDESPYNFFVAASYSEQGRIVLNWIKENHEGGTPTVALLYSDTGFGRSPIEDMKNYAKEIGVDIVDEQIIELSATEAQSQMLNMQKVNPDYAIVQQTWNATATILREAQTLGIETQFIGLNQAVGEGLIEIAGDVANGFMGALTHALPYEDVPGMDEYKEYLDAEGIALEDINMQHVAGWTVAKVMVEGIKEAAKATDGEITGEDLHAALESLRDLDLGGLAPPLTFTSDNHSGTSQVRLGKVVDGKWEAFTDYIGAGN